MCLFAVASVAPKVEDDSWNTTRRSEHVNERISRQGGPGKERMTAGIRQGEVLDV